LHVNEKFFIDPTKYKSRKRDDFFSSEGLDVLEDKKNRPNSPGGCGVAVKLGDRRFLDYINAFLDEIKSTAF
jgi:hypothetical protein